MKLWKLALAPIVAAAMAFSMPASATTWILNTWGGSGSPGAGPWGQVTATEFDSHNVDVTVSLYNPPTTGFVNTGNGEHSAFTFSLSDPSGVTIQNLTAGFTAGPNPATNPAFGTFTNGITCVTCGSGAGSPNPGPLSFRIHTDPITGHTISIGSFIQSTLPPGTMTSLFASDILTNGFTGTVGVSTPVPEPETYAMMLVGFGLLGFVARRRKQSLGAVVPA